jgi:hypothetical protein
MSNKDIQSKAMLAYVIIKTEYEKDDNNLNDVLFHYMHSYLFEDRIDLILYADEFEIYTGKEGIIEEVVNYIFNNIRR